LIDSVDITYSLTCRRCRTSILKSSHVSAIERLCEAKLDVPISRFVYQQLNKKNAPGNRPASITPRKNLPAMKAELVLACDMPMTTHPHTQIMVERYTDGLIFMRSLSPISDVAIGSERRD
jgi:hypothetical protein